MFKTLFMKHKLPKFPDTVRPRFRELSEQLPGDQVRELKPEVERCVGEFEDLARQYETIDLMLVQKLAESSLFLIENYESFSPKVRAAAVGALRYFADSEDGLSELGFASGLHDDVRVMNYVLELSGNIDRVIEFSY